MTKTLIKSFDEITLTHGDILTWEFTQDNSQPVANLYKIEDDIDFAPLTNYEQFKKEISEFFDSYNFSIDFIDIVHNDLIIEGVNWSDDFQLNSEFHQNISKILKSSYYNTQFKIYRFDEIGEGISLRIEAKGDYSKFIEEDYD